MSPPWCWERLKAGGEGDNRAWDGWMASPTWWTWVWANSRSWWWTGRPGMLQSMGLQRVGRDWAAELNGTENVTSSREPHLFLAFFPFTADSLNCTHIHRRHSLQIAAIICIIQPPYPLTLRWHALLSSCCFLKSLVLYLNWANTSYTVFFLHVFKILSLQFDHFIPHLL